MVYTLDSIAQGDPMCENVKTVHVFLWQDAPRERASFAEDDQPHVRGYDSFRGQKEEV